MSFAQHPGLVARLLERYPDAKISTEGEVHDRTDGDTIAYLRGREAAIISLETISDRVLADLPDLRVVSKAGVGLDGIDPRAMMLHGIAPAPMLRGFVLGPLPEENLRRAIPLARGDVLSLFTGAIDLTMLGIFVPAILWTTFGRCKQQR